MGHCDSDYDYDEPEVRKNLNKELKNKLKKMNLSDLHFVDTIISDIDSYRTFFRIIRDGVDTSGNKD